MFSRYNPNRTKSDNIKLLQSQGIDTIGHLPELDSPSFRSSDSVARRSLVLAGLIQLHFEAPEDHVRTWIENNDLMGALSIREKKLLNSKFTDLPKQDRTNVYWFIEAVWAFAWIGGLHNKLTLNTPVEDSLSSMFPNIETMDSAQPFIDSFRLRKKRDIFSKLDYFYRAHWFALAAKRGNESSRIVDLDLIMERRKALEWTCNDRTPWDDISLDT